MGYRSAHPGTIGKIGQNTLSGTAGSHPFPNIARAPAKVYRIASKMARKVGQEAAGPSRLGLIGPSRTVGNEATTRAKWRASPGKGTNTRLVPKGSVLNAWQERVRENLPHRPRQQSSSAQSWSGPPKAPPARQAATAKNALNLTDAIAKERRMDARVSKHLLFGVQSRAWLEMCVFRPALINSPAACPPRAP